MTDIIRTTARRSLLLASVLMLTGCASLTLGAIWGIQDGLNKARWQRERNQTLGHTAKQVSVYASNHTSNAYTVGIRDDTDNDGNHFYLRAKEGQQSPTWVKDSWHNDLYRDIPKRWSKDYLIRVEWRDESSGRYYRAKFVLPHYQYDPSNLELHFLPDNKLLVCVNSYVQTPSYRKWVAGGCDAKSLVPNTESVEIQDSQLRRIESPVRRSK